VTTDAHWLIQIEGSGRKLRRTEIGHVQIGNAELEQRAAGKGRGEKRADVSA
jgi:hypothetical protein